MGISKVVFGSETLLDHTGDTVTAPALKSGITAHGADGEPITGTLLTQDYYVSDEPPTSTIGDDGDLYLLENDSTDFVVAHGTSGGWTWEKWDSGKAVCWGQFDENHSSSDFTEYGTSYYIELGHIAYPFTFESIDSINLNPLNDWSSSAVAYMYISGQTIASNFLTHLLPLVYIPNISDTSYPTGNYGVFAEVIGRWK